MSTSPGSSNGGNANGINVGGGPGDRMDLDAPPATPTASGPAVAGSTTGPAAPAAAPGAPAASTPAQSANVPAAMMAHQSYIMEQMNKYVSAPLGVRLPLLCTLVSCPPLLSLSRLKTANPLLVLSMETLIDEIHGRCKPLTEEELFRVVQTLLLDCYQQAITRLSQGRLGRFTESVLTRGPAREADMARGYERTGWAGTADVNPAFQDTVPPSMEAHLGKISRSFMNTNMSNFRFKEAFDRDFILSRPTFSQVLDNLRRWRDRLQTTIDRVCARAPQHAYRCTSTPRRSDC